MGLSRPRTKKQSTFFDAQLTPQERMAAYQSLPPRTKEALKKAGFKPGQVPTMAQMDALIRTYKEQAVQQMVRACSTALVRRDLAAVNSMMEAVKKGEILGIPPDHKVMDIASALIRLIVQEWELKAYTRFRQNPTSENYARCWGARKDLDALGIEGNTVYPVNPWSKCFVKAPLTPGPYVVAQGDSLSKIAERYYGAANLWDAIFETNGYDGHPDRITPGSSLTIY